MREIKFRAWSKTKRKMACVSALYFDIFDTDKLNLALLVFDGHISECSTHTIIFMQYTGLLDKNGEEIYEGDIVRGIVETISNKYPMCGEVFYDHSGFKLKTIQEKSAEQEERNGDVNYFDFIDDDGDIFSDMEIIGNIYENPELLKP